MSIKRFFLVISCVVAFVLLSITGVIAQDDSPITSVLQVIDVTPQMGEELDLQGAITVYFDRALDCDNLADVVRIEPDVAGQLDCGAEGMSLTFTPQQVLSRGTTYTVTITESLRGVDGAQVLEPYVFELNTVGFLEVSQVLPAPDTPDIGTDSVVTVIFNRPVVALGANPDDLPNPLSISPAIEGTGEWVNTSIYTFTPDLAWAGGTEYTLVINAGLEAVDGGLMNSAYSWTFSTGLPQVTGVIPVDATGDVWLDQSIQMTFNQVMNQTDVEEKFLLYRDDLGAESAVSGAFEWADDGMGFRFVPDAELLDINVLYRVGFASPPEGIAGGELSGFAGTSFATVPFPAIVGTDPFDGQINVPPFGGFRLFFASPMNQDSFEGLITIEPEPWLEPEIYYYDWDNSMQVSFPTEPSTDYTITIDAGFEDQYGNVIAEGLSFSYTTDSYTADVSLQAPGDVGFYNASLPQTQLFLTHRNISRLDLQLYHVPLRDFGARMLDPDIYDPTFGFVPSPNNLIRNWQIASDTPENARRYELLNLGDASVGSDTPIEQCPNALPTRVGVGDSAIVITEPDPLRARDAAIDGEIIELLYQDYVFTIVDGPVCDSGITWWGVRLRDERIAWIAEGVGDEYFIDLRSATETTQVTVPTAGIDNFVDGESLIPGIYFLRADSPETQELGWDPKQHFMVVGTANLFMQTSVDSVTVWATDVHTGQPIASVPITIYNRNFSEVVTGITDQDGVLRVDIPRMADLYVPLMAVLQAPDHFGVTYHEWSNGISPWNFGQEGVFYPPSYEVYLYTDRPIYRPDQPVYFRGVVRSVDDATYTPSGLATVPVEIFNSEGEIIYNQQVAVTEYGTFSDQFTLADDAALGNYRISVDLSDPASFVFDGGNLSFAVAEFRLPEFQVTVESPVPEVVQGDTIDVTVDSRFFFGGVVSNADVEYNVIANPYYFEYEGSGRYDFTDFNPDGGPGEFYGTSAGVVASGVGTTDSAGMLTIEIPADLEDASQSQVFTVEAVVTDESEQAVAGRTEVVVHQGEIYIGARPENYVSVADEASTVNFIAVDWESNPIANQAIDIEITERRWFSVQEQDSNGRTVWTWDVEEIPVTEGDVITDDNGQASFIFTPPNGGVFKVTITSLDSQGNEVRASTTMWVSSREYVSWRQQNSNRIDLVTDKTDYLVGDTAQILITSPFQGEVNALVSVLRGDVLSTERIVMDSNSYVYELPITADHAPNVFVSVYIVNGVNETNPVAAFRMGTIRLGVENTRQELTIEITPDTEQAGPGDTVTYSVRTMDYAGTPVQAEVGVGLTDLASLSIADPNSIPILNAFYGNTGLSVRSATPLTINTDQITQTVLDTIKGGGGGFGEGGIFDIREDFVDTAFWNASLITDENGMASFEVTLPDNLTTWRLDARAVTSGVDGRTLVGQDTFDLLSTRPLLIRPVTPRFFVVGDQVILGAVVNNNTDEAQAVDVTLEGTGITFADDNATQSLIIPAGGRERFDWQVTVEDVEAVDVTFFVINDGETFADASEPPLGQGDEGVLPVYRYEAPDIVGTGGILRQAGNRTEAIVLPPRFEVTEGELTVNIEPSLAATAMNSFEVLWGYGNESIESTVSRFLPNLFTSRAIQNLGLEGFDVMQAQLDGEVSLALQRLYARQKVDGGWGWFVQDVSNPMVTAYALIGLVEARNSGYVVEQRVIQRAVEYLQTQYVAIGLNVADWEVDRQAFILYATQLAGTPNVAQMSVLFDNRDRLSHYAKALLALTLYNNDPNDRTRLDALMVRLVSDATISANGVHWEEENRDYYNWNTDTRTTAMVLQAIVRIDPANDLIPNVVRWLMVARTADAWETTQETAWAVMALTDYMVLSGELRPDYSYSASLNDGLLAQGNATPQSATISQTLFVQVASLFNDRANMLTFDRSEGSGVLYYTAYLRTFLPVPEIESVNRGVIIERQYSLLDDPDGTPITSAQVGDLVQVRLTIIAPNDLHYVVIEDPIPAGTDAVNPELTTSQQIGTRPMLNPQDPLSVGWGWWWFSNIDFRDEMVVLNSTYLPAGTYEYVYTIRAGLEGVYNVIPATGREFYFPEVFGRTDGAVFTITSGE